MHAVAHVGFLIFDTLPLYINSLWYWHWLPLFGLLLEILVMIIFFSLVHNQHFCSFLHLWQTCNSFRPSSSSLPFHFLNYLLLVLIGHRPHHLFLRHLRQHTIWVLPVLAN